MLLWIYFILQFFFIFFDLLWVYWVSTEFIEFLPSLLSFYQVYWLSTDFSKYFSSVLFLVDFIPIFCRLLLTLPSFTTVNRKFLHTNFLLSSTSVKIEIFTDFYRSKKKWNTPGAYHFFLKCCKKCCQDHSNIATNLNWDLYLSNWKKSDCEGENLSNS